MKEKELKKGITYTFGNYYQSTDGKKTPIEWNVLDTRDGKALLISKYALDSQPYNTDFEDVTWESCTLRKWLNKTFINNAFSEDEQKRIQDTLVTADKNPGYDTNPGNNTTDKIFLLSINEVEKYFSSNDEVDCEPTDYAISQGVRVWQSMDPADSKITCWWWLRSPGYDSNRAACVSSGGLVNARGNGVDGDDDAVRPALWINLDS